MSLAALLLAGAALSTRASAVETPADADGGPIARGRGDLTIERAELEQTLLDRYAYSENGRELLDLFLKARLLDSLATQRGVKVSDAEVARRWKELEERARASGGAGLADEMQRRGLSPEQFREFLRLALVQERLTRAALGLSSKAEVSGDQQELWIEQEIQTRGLELLPPAADMDGTLARCGELTVTREEFGHFLLERLTRETVRESAWHLLLRDALDKRMPDLAPAARSRAIEEEIARRREKHAAEYPTLSFEQRLGATGRTIETLRRDPSVAIAALSRLWVDRTAGPEGVRSTYEKERELFEARHGEALRTSLLFLVAGRFVNDLCPRTFKAAEEDLSRVASRCSDEKEFASIVERRSEEPASKKAKGDLGWVTRGDGRVPGPLREALFQLLDTGGQIPERGRPVGPVRLDSGVGLLWVTARRPSPPWEEMSERVHEELRRRLIEDVMPLESVELLYGDG